MQDSKCRLQRRLQPFAHRQAVQVETSNSLKVLLSLKRNIQEHFSQKVAIRTSSSVMPSKVYSAAVVGVEAFEVEIEVHAGWGITDKIAVVGL
jgi:hypothetical protein